MKVFISWSGSVSHEIAKVLRDWIPFVLQSVVPFVSSEDIDKGTRWNTDIANELSESKYGIICVTKENLQAPWLNFEAGALSKQISQSNVSPFLFDMKKSEVTGPLAQFQLTINEREDTKKLISSINKASEFPILDAKKLDLIFEQWWPNFKAGMENIKVPENDIKENDDITIREVGKIVEQLLELNRLQVNILKNPRDLFPIKELEEIIRLQNESLLNRPSALENKYRRGEIFQLFQFIDNIAAQMKQFLWALNQSIADGDLESKRQFLNQLNESYTNLLNMISKLKTYM